MKRKISIALLGCILLACPVLAQHAHVHTLDRSTGLSGNSVTATVQDSVGFIWIATKSGLNRYDGTSIRIYDAGNTIFSSADISDLLIDSAGTLHVVTSNGGFYRYNYGGEDFTSLGEDEFRRGERGQIAKIFESKEGKIYLATSEGLVEYYNGEFRAIDYYIDDTAYRIIAMDFCEDSRGDLWIASHGDGLLLLRDGRLQKIVPPDGPTPLHILSVEQLGKSGLWVGTQGSGLFTYHFDTGIFDAANSLIGNNADIIRKIVTDGSEVWIATEGDGIYIIDTLHHVKHLSKQSEISLSGESVTDIFKDRQGNFWVGTAWNGVNIVSSLNVDHTPFGQVDVPVLSAYVSPGFSMIGTDGNGLWVLDERGRGVERPFSEGQVKYVQFITPSEGKRFWLGTFANGLIEFEKGRGITRHFNQSSKTNPISFNDVRDVVEADSGDLWIATWGGGLNYFSASKKTSEVILDHDAKKGKRVNNILDLLEAEDGRLYAATFGDGLLLVDRQTFSFRRIDLATADPAKSNPLKLLVLHQDASGNIWIGTWEDGLLRYNPENGTCEHFDKEMTLGRKTFVSIEEDAQGNLWFGTKSGMVKFVVAENSFHALSELEGEFHIKASFKDQHGRLYFGNTEGLISVDPLHFKNREDSVRVIFTDLRIFGEPVASRSGVLAKSVTLSDNISLRYDQNVISVAYSALKFPHNNKITYQIRLEGLEKDWRNVGNQTSATYSNLSAGSYTFLVNALQDGILVGHASIDLSVDRPPWATWWAYLFYLLFLSGIVIGLVKGSMAWEKVKNNLRIEKITHEKELELHTTKQRFFVNISHEIRTPVTVILGAVERITDDAIVHKYLKDHIRAIQKNGNYLLNLVNELLDYRKLESGQIKLAVTEIDLSTFMKEIFVSFQSKAEECGVSYRLNDQTGGEILWCDAHQMEKAVFNLLANAFKYVDEGDSVELNISADDQHVFIRVVDSGIGIPPDKQDRLFDMFYQVNTPEYPQKGFGIGLAIVKEIVTLHQGQVDFQSVPGAGSTFCIKLLKGNYHFQNLAHVEIANQESPDNLLPVALPDDVSMDYTILIVEDSDQIRSYLTSIFEKAYRVLQAHNGQQGFAIARAELPDLVISDVLMPVKDGIQLTKELKADYVTHHIPVVLLTARTGLVFKKEGFDIGADDYISKPFNPQLLASRVRNLIHSRKKLWERYKSWHSLTPDNVHAEDPDLQFISALRKIIQENILENEINSKFLAREMGMSHSVIYKKLKQLTGLSMVEFIREFKLTIAAELLKKYNCSVQEACFKSGFSDRRYFSRAFKERFGKSPSEFGARTE